MWPLGHFGHVRYSFINMLLISTGIFDDKLRPQILSVGTTANAALRWIWPWLQRIQRSVPMLSQLTTTVTCKNTKYSSINSPGCHSLVYISCHIICGFALAIHKVEYCSHLTSKQNQSIFKMIINDIIQL